MTIADKVRRAKTDLDEVHAAGVEEGKALGGYTEGYEDGKQAEYDAFWDAYQENGNRTNYFDAFAGPGWTEATFVPKYDIKPQKPYRIFAENPMKIDLPAKLNELGIEFDFSRVTSEISYAFYGASFTRVGKIDISGYGGTAVHMFSKMLYLEKIDEIVFGELNRFSSFIDNCPELVDLTASGTIGNGGLNLQWSTKLSKASITSIINALSDTASGQTLTLSATAVGAAFEMSPADYDGDGKNEAWIGNGVDEWYELIGAKSNWTIVAV